MAKKRRRRKIELGSALVPLSIYRDEGSCRAWIAWLEKQLRRAYRILEKLISSSQTPSLHP